MPSLTNLKYLNQKGLNIIWNMFRYVISLSNVLKLILFWRCPIFFSQPAGYRYGIHGGLYSPPPFLAESARTPSIPRTVLGLNSDWIRTFFGWTSSQISKSESEISLRTVLGQSEDCSNSSDCPRMESEHCLRTIRGLSEASPSTVRAPTIIIYI